MAGYRGLQTFPLSAAADLSTQQYHIVNQSASKSCNLASLATTNNICGVLQNKPNASGRTATIADGGTSKVVAGAAITQGKYFTTNGSGRAVTVTSGDMAVGRALETVGADGDVFEGRLTVPFRWSGAP